MHKKTIAILIALCLLLSISACNEARQNSSERDLGQDTALKSETWSSDGSVISGKEKELTESPDAWPILEYPSKTEEWIYDSMTDANPFVANCNYCESENNIYMLDYPVISSFDKETHTYLPLCNRPECTHTTMDCNAYAGGAFGLQYYNNKVYTVLLETEYGESKARTIRASLYGFAADGSTRERVRQLFAVERDEGEENEISYDIHFIIHKGYIYYWYQFITQENQDDRYRDGNNCIFCVPLESSLEDVECVYAMQEMSDVDSYSFVIKPYGEYLYFTDIKDSNGKISRINIRDKQVERLPLQDTIPVNQFYVEPDCIYYWSDKDDTGKIKAFYFEDNSTEVLFDFNKKTSMKMKGLFYDGTYFYINVENEDKSYSRVVLDSSFQIIGKIEPMKENADNFWDTMQDVVLVKDSNNLLCGWMDKKNMEHGNFEFYGLE